MELIIGFVCGTLTGVVFTYAAMHKEDPRSIEKDLSESYRGETFERRAKRASK